MTLRRRLKAAEERADRRSHRHGGRLTWAEADDLARESATPEEVAEMERLVARHDARRGGPPPEGERRAFDPAADARLYELWEGMLERVYPFWAAEFRRFRDLPTIALEQLEEEWEAAGRKRSTWESDREFWQVKQAAWSRWEAVRRRGAPVVTDAEEARRIVAAVREKRMTIDEISAFVGWG